MMHEAERCLGFINSLWHTTKTTPNHTAVAFKTELIFEPCVSEIPLEFVV